MADMDELDRLDDAIRAEWGTLGKLMAARSRAHGADLTFLEIKIRECNDRRGALWVRRHELRKQLGLTKPIGDDDAS